MRKELDKINTNWDARKKKLEHEIDILSNTQNRLIEDKNKEKKAAEKAQKGLQKKINILNGETALTDQGIGKYEIMISNLKQRE